MGPSLLNPGEREFKVGMINVFGKLLSLGSLNGEAGMSDVLRRQSRSRDLG